MEKANNPTKAARAPIATGLECLAFTLGDEEYGIDIQRVQEPRGYEAVNRIANAPEFIKGVLNLAVSSCRSWTCASGSISARRPTTSSLQSSFSTSPAA